MFPPDSMADGEGESGSRPRDEGDRHPRKGTVASSSMSNDDSSSPVDEPLSSSESRNPAADSTEGRPTSQPASVSEPPQGPARVAMIAVAPLLFFSGLCALVYQVAWLRELKLVFGASTAANAAVLAVFMGGLGVGGLLLGKRADRLPRPLELYANLELGVALSAALTPLLVLGGRKLYLAIGGSSVLGLSGATIVRLLLTVVVLGVPTFLMGGTLPAAAKAVSSASDARRRDVGTLYAVNTLGAVTGAFAANFVLLEVFGTRMTLWLACLVNALVGMTARAVSRRSATMRPDAPVPLRSRPARAPCCPRTFGGSRLPPRRSRASRSCSWSWSGTGCSARSLVARPTPSG